MKRRPTASDRDIADALARLRPGSYRVIVEKEGDDLLFTGLARLKPEGSMRIDVGDVCIMVMPEISAQAA